MDMSHEKEKILLDGKLVDVLGSGAFRAVLGNGHDVVAFCAKTPQPFPELLCVGKNVTLEFFPYDMGKARILHWKGES
jgi:translation initiation factor IF-1